MIVFIHRDEMFNPESTERNKAELIIGKHRNGPTGSVPLTFHREYTRFETYAEDSDAYEA
jgi:replicative DNA helicase